jgi:hypothetical protein
LMGGSSLSLWGVGFALPPPASLPAAVRLTPYPIEFHRRLEQKWPSRIEQILTVRGTAPPPRDPNDDDDDEVEDEEDEDQSDEPAVVREPDED